MAERHTEVGLSKRKRRLQWSNVNVQKVVVTLTFLFVPLFLLILFTYLPFFKMVQFSFYDMKYIGERKFVGLENYIDVFTRDDCFNALKLSLYYMVGSVVQLALALLFATILSFNPKGGSFFPWRTVFPEPGLRHCRRVYLQVFLHPRFCPGLHPRLAGNPGRYAAVLAQGHPHQ